MPNVLGPPGASDRDPQPDESSDRRPPEPDGRPQRQQTRRSRGVVVVWLSSAIVFLANVADIVNTFWMVTHGG